MNRTPSPTAVVRSRVSSDASSWRIVAATMIAAIVLGVIVAISPILGAGCFLAVIAATRIARSGTFAVAAFLASGYAEAVSVSSGFSPIKLTGAALVISSIAFVVQPGGGARQGVRRSAAWLRHPVILVALVGFITVGMLSYTWAVDLTQVRSLSIRLLADAAVFLAIGVCISSPAQIRVLGWVALAGATLSTCYGVAVHAQVAGRFIGASLDPNEYAALIIPSLALGYASVVTSARRSARMAGWLCAVICVSGLVTSQSRGGLIAALVMGIVLLCTARGTERVRMGVVVVVLMALGGGYLVATPSGSALLGRVTSGDSSGRTDLWRVAGRMMEQHPWSGVGLGNYPVLSSRYLDASVHHAELFIGAPRTVHNSILEIGSELGIFGLGAFLLFTLGCLVVLYRAYRHARRTGDMMCIQLGRGLLAAMVSNFTMCIFLSGQYQELLWVTLSLSLVYAAMIGRVDHTD